tara:strand:+ start:1057 stop:2373 length:1317 start_codon:yes stop_codon:yes gene_type:complete
MPITRDQPSPQRQTVLTFVSPNVQDLLFFETVDAQRVGKVPPAYGTAHPDTVNYPNHILAYVRQADATGQLYFYYYVNSRSSQDEYNFEFSQSSLGQTKFNTVVRTYIELRSKFTEDATAHAAGAAMPVEPASANFSGKGYVLMGREQKRIGDSELDGVFVVEQRVYFDPTAIKTLVWDDLSSYHLAQTLTYHYRGQSVTFQYSGATLTSTIEATIADGGSAYWATKVTDSSATFGTRRIGSYREGRQVSSDWFEVAEKEVIAGAASGTNIITVNNYSTAMDHTFPPVLERINIIGWETHDGQLKTYVEYDMNPEAFRGSCTTDVSISWSPSPFNSSNGGKPTVQNFQPQSFSFGTPYVSIDVPPCLMDAAKLGTALAASTGTSDPVYKYSGYIKHLPTTSPKSIPATHVAKDTQEPARGGYLRTKWTVHKPDYPELS